MRLNRLAAALALAVHLLVGGGEALAHALHGPEEAGPSHVESADQDPCPEHRSHDDCPHCRHANDRCAPDADHADVAPLTGARGRPLRPRDAAPRLPSIHTPLLPRAPPGA